MKKLACLVLGLILAGCSLGGKSDLEKFVADTGKDLQGKVEPLPTVKPYEPFEYNAFELPDPFKPRKLSPKGSGGGLQPDLARPREPLEAYSLETLKMVGVLEKKGVFQAVIKTPDNTIYHVHKGNYVGQNFGMVVGISDSEVKLREIVQDSAGDWTARDSTLTLQE
ncbi:MAG: pilus assembly protein PilP [Thiobacillaceae bacterium]